MRAIALLALVTACAGNAKTAEPRRAEAFAARAVPPTVIYVVRHAEAAAPSGDPSLSADGVARAQRLLALMADKQLAAIDTTQLQRSFETGKIVADALGLTVDVQPVDPANVVVYPPALAAHVKETHAGMATLIVGHSNTVPATVEALCGTGVPPIDITEFDRLYTITIAADGSAQLESSTY